ncbi:MAG: bifunctional 4-hydroxy-2-oxoglutarate aldolase/2-dehydro-3-deoxy-phosphogluconate aldolase [Hydrogenophilaceae bacterium]|jgi:2-dehydro-3-deoxyphosphogluconate aldolase/(4S)-4-hydroxy-2-oxoglutarate aldolase|nr:bifunctional 4-hydroxy-2-oxoglutarate aldolase/2-dehydro-3-deoxy-phosphogluconate aldolase [Hydrogenophilaceae bacterium]
MLTSAELMRAGPVMAVLTLEAAADAVPVARALLAGGIRALEVTLRTPEALRAIEALSGVDGALAGAGTVLCVDDAARAAAAGARFLVSPGFRPALADAARRLALPWLPGVATASEIMAAREAGFDDLKFFPAETSGGAAAVAAFAGPFPMARFCPTGGITQANAPRYLALANVACVGGSWLAPRDLVARRDWAEIEARARAAAALARG